MAESAETLEEIVAGVFGKTGRRWKVVNPDAYIEPSPDDVQEVLDHAVVALRNEPTGTTYNRGGLIVEKVNLGYDVYVHVGRYY